MNIALTQKTSLAKNKAVLVSFFSSKVPSHPFLKTLPKEDAAYVAKIMAHDFTTNQEKFREVHLPSDPDFLILLAHLGKKEEWNEKKYRLFVRKFVSFLKERRIPSAAVFLADIGAKQCDDTELVSEFAQQALMADFTFHIYKEPPKEGWPAINEIEIVSDGAKNASLQKSLQDGIIIGEEMNNCRTLANTPGGDMTPQTLADAARSIGKRTDSAVTVLEEKEIEKLGMGGIMGVSKGSDAKPKFIIMEYGKKFGGKPVIYVGKGVTFDTGGLNLKPSDAIYEMHMDMTGGAAVMHALAAIARMKISVHVIGLIPAVENMPSGSSYRPGDILKTITGKTIEVLNTDAEGRVILADALGYAQRLKPRLIADVATLTGAAVVALGQHAIALFSSSGEQSRTGSGEQSRTANEKLEKFARDIGDASGDYVWPLPLWDEYLEDIKGTFGDVANAGKKGQGGAITGAMFLKQFVGEYPWIHLDIAPTMTTIEGQFLAKGASGTGVRFLVELARNANKIPVSR
ncbi:MAG: hypothetical protein A2934_02440 [Candidatus Sungbacteria bacterium RIFCSPLOWO2_01_FULL_47_10]|uniref:Probable cytosol aminopeptidase n=1 Tax=Candidatus Sungbacteria bacterium RIFCSPLOWO2_01_FULL_47_10 TaxID=1802276 RepID=A0A1G2L742_9BACT|nr:MAG: hypothetical protein A2934_02440 [Candidatus Sungbacteria bacterium RIFCSPLOWO2_01_FULL_47_10]